MPHPISWHDHGQEEATVKTLKKWQEDYRAWLAKNPRANEYEWRVELRHDVFQKGLGYRPDQIQYERERTDLRIVSQDSIPYFLVETKLNDKALDTKKTLSQAKGYLKGGERFIALCSKTRLKIYDPAGEFLGEMEILDPEIEQNSFFQVIHSQHLENRRNFDEFRRGTMKGGYLRVDSRNPDNLEKLVAVLRYSSNRLLKYVSLAYDKYRDEYAEYNKLNHELERSFNSIVKGAVTPHYYQTKYRQYLLKRHSLKRKYKVSIDIFERSFPIFEQVQPFSKSPSSDPKKREKEIREIYFTDVAYAALNRILFIRIAEDRKLTSKMISNGGIRAWRDLFTFLKDRYQDLLKVAFDNTSRVYSHFFEHGIFDWYLDADGHLNGLLEEIFYLLNSFDLSKMDSDILSDLYQQYLPSEKRKRLGEFYTPPEVAEYILRSVGYPGEGKLLDFACGSGGFLVPAARMRLEQLKKKGVGAALRLEALQEICGIDINPFATHITEMNMLFLILETYLEAKAESTDYELKRIPIFTTDALVSVAAISEGDELFEKDNALDTVRDMDIEAELGAFTWVVGNPPYVRNERLPEDYRILYKKAFEDIAKGNADLYTYFMRRGMDWLKEGGRMGIIVSMGIADSGASENIREFFSNFRIERIVSLESIKVFEASTNPIIVIIKKSKATNSSEVDVVNDLSEMKDLRKKDAPAILNQKRWLNLTQDIDRSWRVEVRRKDLEILEKLSQGVRIFKGSYGMALRDEAGGRKMISSDPDELENPVPLLDGREIRRWTVNWQGRYLNYLEKYISTYEPPSFFEMPVILVPRISRTIQATLLEVGHGIPGECFVSRNTVMHVRTRERDMTNQASLVCLLNNTLCRYFVSLLLRGGAIQEYYSTFYVRVIDSVPVDQELLGKVHSKRFAEFAGTASSLSEKIHRGDELILKEMDSFIGVKTKPFGLCQGSDFSGYVTPIVSLTAQVNDKGVLVSGDNLSRIKGDPFLMQYILSFSQLREVERLSKEYLERFPIPEDRRLVVQALEKMQKWFEEKPELLNRLKVCEGELDDYVFENTKCLTKKDIDYIEQRVRSHPLDKIIVTTSLGSATKSIPHKRWIAGERYKE